MKKKKFYLLLTIFSLFIYFHSISIVNATQVVPVPIKKTYSYKFKAKEEIAKNTNVSKDDIVITGVNTELNSPYVIVSKSQDDYSITISNSKISGLTNNDSFRVGITYTVGSDTTTNQIMFLYIVKASNNDVCCKMPSGYKFASKDSCNSNNVSEESFCSSTNSDNSSTDDKTAACFKYTAVNGTFYKWMTLSDLAKDGNASSYTQIDGITSSDECQKQTPIIDGSEISEADEEVKYTTTVTGTSTDTGNNSCNYFLVTSRGNNYKKSGQNYSLAANGHAIGEYNIYTAKYDTRKCSNVGTENIRTFCIDPGARGPINKNVSYSATKKVDQKSELMRAIYRLYSNWYIDEKNSNEIKSGGGDDYLDFIVNTAARVIISEYGTYGFDFYEPSSCDSRTSQMPGHYYLFYNLKNSKFRFPNTNNQQKTINRIMEDVEKYVKENSTIPTGENEVEFKVEASTPVLTDANTGFEVEFVVKLKSESKTLIEAAKKSLTITAATESGTAIELDKEKDITVVNDWSSEPDTDGYYTAKYKVSKNNAYSLLGEDDNLKVKVNIAYTSEKSIDNILLLTPNTTPPKDGQSCATKYQKFLTFTHGNVAKTADINVEMSKSQENTCRAAFALPCTSSGTVFYLIEGTQSGTLFNSIIGGINNIGDFRNLISNATSMVEYLKNIGQSGLNLSNLKNLSSLLYNFADRIGVTKNLKKELSFLNTLAKDKNNKTAAQLYSTLNKLDFNGTGPDNFQTLVTFFTSSILNVLGNGYDTVKTEWQEILEYSKSLKISTSTKELLELINNSISSAKDSKSLEAILNGSSSLAKELMKSTGLEKIKSDILSLSSTLQMVISANGDGITGVLDFLGSIKDQIFSAADLSSVSGLLDTVKNGLTVNWEKCIIGEGNTEATDPNGNSYTVQTSNDYCSIVCKEDYAFKMPGNLGTTYSGRYISTNLDNVYHATVGIAGQRTCVTTSVDNEKYLEEASSDKDGMLTAYNSYMKNYAFFKNLEAQPAISKPVSNEATMIDVDEVMGDLTNELYNSVSKLAQSVLRKIVGSGTSEEYYKYLTAFSNNFSGFTQSILGQAGFGTLNAANIITYFSATLENVFDVQSYVDKIPAALEEVKGELVDVVTDFATETLRSVGSAALGAVGKTAITALCQFSRLIGANVVCDIYSKGSNAFKVAISTANEGTQSSFKLFNITELVSYDYEYNIYEFKDKSNNEKKLSSEFMLLDQKGRDSGKTDSDELEGWIMESGSYILKSMHFGIYLNFGNLSKGFESIKDAYNATSDVVGKINTTLKAIQSATGIVNNPSLGGLKSLNDSSFSNKLSKDNINNIVSVLNNIFSVVNEAQSMISSSERDISLLLDNVIDAYYYFRGTFDTYYNSLAQIRTTMKEKKKLYEEYRDSLISKAANMNSCTIWEKEFQMEPEITFTYGYKNNNLLDFIASKNNITTDYIKLEAINKPSEPDVSTYYCYKDVDINQIQDWNNIMDGTCVTSDGILGSILNALIDTNGAGSEIAKWFGDNKETLSQLFSNFQNIPGVKDLTDSICNSNSKLCDLFNIQSEDDVNGAVNTYIPGSIVYDFASIATNGGQLFKDASKSLTTAIANGDLKEFEKAIVQNLYVKDVNKDSYTVKYRNVKRVATVSRYGNPGVAISGINWQSILSNVATWLSNKFGGSSSTFINKINNAISSINGQGSQEFIYYQSSQQYWTSSNKGIYTKAPTSSDSVLVDTGDEALTKNEIVTADGSTKEPNGKVYPIALSTAAGTYSYQLIFNNIGQYYNNTFSLGRIVDNNGYVSGLLSNQYVCKYEVKSEPDTPNASCEDILESADCKDDNGYFKDLYKNQQNYTNTNGIDYESKWNACITKLLAENDSCCYLIDSNNVPNASQDRYNSMCNSKCQGIKLIGSDSAIKDSSSSNAALISKNGNLQFYTKVVSNYDFFPNGEGSKGYNWSGLTSGYENVDENGKPQPQKVSEIQKEMEGVGDNTYANDDEYLDYSITLNGACMAKIKEYNDQQELNDLGFGDYTLGSISKESREYQSKFLKDLEDNPEYASCQKAITNQLQK